MSAESTFDKIVRKTGFKPVNCKCNVCKSQCATPCFGTPEDMLKIIGAGYEGRVAATVIDGVEILLPMKDRVKNSCTFFTNGLCELHESGLKPTVGKLAHHSTTMQGFNLKKSPSYLVINEWKNITKEQLKSLVDKYVKNNFNHQPNNQS